MSVNILDGTLWVSQNTFQSNDLSTSFFSKKDFEFKMGKVAFNFSEDWVGQQYWVQEILKSPDFKLTNTNKKVSKTFDDALDERLQQAKKTKKDILRIKGKLLKEDGVYLASTFYLKPKDESELDHESIYFPVTWRVYLKGSNTPLEFQLPIYTNCCLPVNGNPHLIDHAKRKALITAKKLAHQYELRDSATGVSSQILSSVETTGKRTRVNPSKIKNPDLKYSCKRVTFQPNHETHSTSLIRRLDILSWINPQGGKLLQTMKQWNIPTLLFYQFIEMKLRYGQLELVMNSLEYENKASIRKPLEKVKKLQALKAKDSKKYQKKAGEVGLLYNQIMNGLKYALPVLRLCQDFTRRYAILKYLSESDPSLKKRFNETVNLLWCKKPVPFPKVCVDTIENNNLTTKLLQKYIVWP